MATHHLGSNTISTNTSSPTIKNRRVAPSPIAPRPVVPRPIASSPITSAVSTGTAKPRFKANRVKLKLRNSKQEAQGYRECKPRSALKFSRARLRLLALLSLVFGTLILSQRFPVVTQVEVFGNAHYSAEQIKALANIDIGSPFLWLTPISVKALSSDPWIAQVSIYKHFPEKVSIRVTEREAFITDGRFTYAKDGTLLTDVTNQQSSKNTAITEGLIRFSGWGVNRQVEMLALVTLLTGHDLEPKMISYTPAGFTVLFENKQLYTPSLEALRTHWASFLNQTGTRVYVYPWGVSTVND